MNCSSDSSPTTRKIMIRCKEKTGSRVQGQGPGRGRLALLACAAVAVAIAAGCAEEGRDWNPPDLHSFRVTLGDGPGAVSTGEAGKPVPYVSGTSCDTATCPGNEECLGYCSISGNACIGDDGCSTGDFCARVCARPVYLNVETIGREGKRFDIYEGRQVGQMEDLWVHIRMVPGFVPPSHEYVKLIDGRKIDALDAQGGFIPPMVPWARLDQGKAEGIKVYVAQAIGESYVWVEDIGLGLPELQYGQCNNDVDDDGDGFVDLADPDCVDPSDPREQPASYATGLSPAFYFETPRIWHLQYTDQVSSSPLEGQDIFVDKGKMVVTNIVTNGFYVTDAEYHKPYLEDGTPAYFNSLFLYTYSKPDGLNYLDVLCSFSGGVVEYQGNTQLTFPTFEVYRKNFEAYGKSAPCETRDDIKGKLPAPPAVDVTDLLQPENPSSSSFSDVVMENARLLEPYESSLIKIRDVALSTRYLGCDSDEDESYPSGSDDDTCRDLCQQDMSCTQLESFFKYSQLAATAQASNKKFYVGTDMLMDAVPLEIPYIGSKDQSGNCPSIVDPETGDVIIENPHKIIIGDSMYVEYTCPAPELKSMTGNLRQIYLCSAKPGKKEKCGLQMTMLIPRFDADFEFAEEGRMP